MYKEQILDLWIHEGGDPQKGDDRFRCFFIDAAVDMYGKFVELVQSSAVNGAFTLVGEAIAEDPEARAGAPWFSLARYSRGPWWNVGVEGRFNKNLGYNIHWTAGDWDDTPIHFGILASGNYLNLALTASPQPDENASNMQFEDIYRWVRYKKATPVAWGGQYAKVGAAWDYATNRIVASRQFRSPRLFPWSRV